jgi:hypothetical protein
MQMLSSYYYIYSFNGLIIKYGCSLGTMDNLLVYYGDVVREGPSGVDVSMCGSTTVVVRDMVQVGYAAVRRCIRAAFGRE